MKKNKSRAVLGAATAVVVGVFVGGLAVTGISAIASEDATSNEISKDGRFPIYTNEAGQTYGSSSGYIGSKDIPDLISVYANDGVTEGYVYSAELYANDPTTPEEVDERSKAGTLYQDVTVDVYLSDGKTKVGQFTMEG